LTSVCRAEISNQPAIADTTDRKVWLLDTVRVVADKPEETIGAVHVLDYTNDKGNAALNLYQGLQDIAGISNTVGTKDESSLRIRGFRRNEVKILVNGRPLNGGYFGNIDLQQLAPSDIREIQIVKGPGSAVFGSGTMGGVVNILTSDPYEKDWFKLSLLAKRNNSNRVGLTVSHRLGDLGFWIYAAREHNSGIVLSRNFPGAPFEDGVVRDHSRKTEYDVQTRLDYQIGLFSRLGVSGGVTIVPEKLIPSSIYALDYREYKDWLRDWATLEYENILSEYLKLGVLAYLDGGKDTYLQYNDAAHQHLNMDSTMRYHTLGFNPRLEWAPDGKNTVSAGLRGESYFSTRKDNGSYPDWTPHTMEIFNAFGQWQMKASELVSCTAGIGVSGSRSDLRPEIKLNLEPSAGIYLHWNGMSMSFASIGRNTSFPTMRQLFSADRGNPDLLPQSALKAEAGHRQAFQIGEVQTSAEISLFYNDARNLIDVLDGSYQNIYRVRSYGAETALEFSWRPGWETRLSYNWIQANNEDNYILTETPAQQAILEQNIRLPWQINLAYLCSYTDIRRSQDTYGNYHTLKSYWKHDLSLFKQFGRHSVSLGLENILDAYYETEYGYPAEGLNFFVRLEARL
jgi:outer membrane cobalamin receptor